MKLFRKLLVVFLKLVELSAEAIAHRVEPRANQPSLPEFDPDPPAAVTLDLSPTEVEILTVSERVVIPVDFTPSIVNRNHLVQMLLDEAWAQGLTTYEQLIGYVKDHTGEGCSRRAIARWKRERKLLSDAA